MTECLPNPPRYARQRVDGQWEGADHPDGPWRSIPAPQQALPWTTDGPAAQSREPASVTPEATGQPRQLSPAAQAVMDAANGASSYGPDDCLNEAPQIALATILALADQVIGERCQNESERRIYDRLRRIAAELEGLDA